MEVTEQAIRAAKDCFAVWRFKDAPAHLRAHSKHEDPEWLIATDPRNLEDGIPFWIDLMDPEDMERTDVNDGLCVLVA